MSEASAESTEAGSTKSLLDEPCPEGLEDAGVIGGGGGGGGRGTLEASVM